MENYDPVKAEGHGKKAIFIIVVLGALAAGGYYLMQKNGDDVPIAIITPAPTAEPIDNSKLDSDSDGIPDAVELAIGTNPNRMNSDSDDYNDLPEIKNGYSPLAAGSGGKYTPEQLQILMDKIKAADPEFYEKEFGAPAASPQDSNTDPVGAISPSPAGNLVLVYPDDYKLKSDEIPVGFEAELLPEGSKEKLEFENNPGFIGKKYISRLYNSVDLLKIDKVYAYFLINPTKHSTEELGIFLIKYVSKNYLDQEVDKKVFVREDSNSEKGEWIYLRSDDVLVVIWSDSGSYAGETKSISDKLKLRLNLIEIKM